MSCGQSFVYQNSVGWHWATRVRARAVRRLGDAENFFNRAAAIRTTNTGACCNWAMSRSSAAMRRVRLDSVSRYRAVNPPSP